MKGNPIVSIIIPFFTQMECSPSGKFPYFTFGKPIKGCIESMESQDYENKEIIFADKDDPAGPGAIRNEASNRAHGEIIFFICCDAIMVDREGISNLVKVFKETDADIVVGCSIPSKSSAHLFTYLLGLEYAEREKNMGEGYVDAGVILYFGIKREVLEEVGGFPLKGASIDTGNLYFDSGFADWDFCGMLKEKGYKIWHTNRVRVYHIYQTDFLSYFKKQFRQAWYRVAYLKRFKKIKEGYTTYRMVGQPILIFLMPIWTLAGLIVSSLWFNLIYISLLLIFFWNTGFALRAYWNTKDLNVFFLLPISFVRSFAWTLGVIKGFFDFYLKSVIVSLSSKTK